MALVLFLHGLCVLFLLAPAKPWRERQHLRRRERAAGRNLVVVFLKPAAPVRVRPAGTEKHRASAHATERHPRRPMANHAAVSRAVSTIAPVQAAPLVTTLPGRSSGRGAPLPAYIPGGRAFQRNLHAARQRERHDILPDNLVAGMPRFAMKDPRSGGMAGFARFMLYGVLGAPDPVCMRARRYVSMSKKKQFAHEVDLPKILDEASLHHCEMKKWSWLDPQGPATHLHANPNMP